MLLLDCLTKKARNPRAQTPDVAWRSWCEQVYYEWLIWVVGVVTGADSEGGLAAAGGPGASQDVGVAPESEERSCGLLGLDGQGGWLQIVGGSVIGLIALYSSYDHINVFGRFVSLNQ